MNKDNLDKAVELKEKLEALTTNLICWEYATCFKTDSIKVVCDFPEQPSELDKFVDMNFIDFEVTKAIALSKIKKEIADLEKEIEGL